MRRIGSFYHTNEIKRGAHRKVGVPKVKGVGRIDLALRIRGSLGRRLDVNTLGPNTHLVAGGLTRRLNVDVAPIHRTLLHLISIGTLSITPTRTFAIPRIKGHRLSRVGQVHCRLRLVTITLTIRGLAPRSLTRLRRLLRGLRRTRRGNSVRRVVGMGELFHLTVCRHSGVPVLYRVVRRL